MVNLILPKNCIDVTGKELYFLAGPIRGAEDWQAEAIRYIFANKPSCYVACPSRYEFTNPSMCRLALSDSSEIDPFATQTLWERYYLERAARSTGGIIFWLPEESVSHPRKKEDGPYAQDSYGELGEWRTRLALETDNSLRITVGAQDNFAGLRTIQRNFDALLSCSYPIYSTLTETLDAALGIE
jgi:hypothetical protein